MYTPFKSLGGSVPLNLSRPALKAAHRCYDNGDILGCAIWLREAVNRHLRAIAELHGLQIAKGNSSAGSLLKVLMREKHIGPSFGSWYREIIDYTNAMAHCRRVEPGIIRCCLMFAYVMMEDSNAGDYDRSGGISVEAAFPGSDDDDDPSLGVVSKPKGGLS